MADPAEAVELPECSICRGTENLVRRPCLCKGSVGTVHVRCLEEWLTFSGIDRCELCSHRFKLSRVRRRDYSFIKSIPILLELFEETLRVLLMADLWLMQCLLILCNLVNTTMVLANMLILLKQRGELESFFWRGFSGEGFLKRVFLRGFSPSQQDPAESLIIEANITATEFLDRLVITLVFIATLIMFNVIQVFIGFCSSLKRKWQKFWNDSSEAVIVYDEGGHVKLD